MQFQLNLDGAQTIEARGCNLNIKLIFAILLLVSIVCAISA